MPKPVKQETIKFIILPNSPSKSPTSVIITPSGSASISLDQKQLLPPDEDEQQGKCCTCCTGNCRPKNEIVPRTKYITATRSTSTSTSTNKRSNLTRKTLFKKKQKKHLNCAQKNKIMNSKTQKKKNSQFRLHQKDESPNLMVTGKNFHQNIIPIIEGDRKTTAEIVSEARTLLGGGGARLVSTNRPITPRDPRRQLYGIKAPPGRPPSAFSLRYLQFESSRILPSLEPIQQQTVSNNNANQSFLDEIPIVPRSGSIGTLMDFVSINNANNNTLNYSCGRFQGKLPALLSPPKITASLENLTEEMPPNHPDFQQNEENPPLQDTNSTDPDKIEKMLTLEKYCLRERQTKSFDMPLKASEKIHFTMSDVNNSKIDLMTMNSKKDVLNITPITTTKMQYNKISHGYIHKKYNNDNIDGDSGSIDEIDNEILINSEEFENDESNWIRKTRLLSRTNDLMAQSTTETLLELLKAHAGIKECNEETVQHINAILIELYTRVKGATKGNWRGAILGGLYGLVECTSGKILLAVARVVLALCVTGSNLTGACKLVFKVARNETNDYLFTDTDVPELLIDGLGRASPLDDPEACIYGYGAVRFLANSSQNMNIINGQKSIAYRLARHGSVQLMVLHLQILNETGASSPLTGPPLHALYQLSAALRALAGIQQTGKMIGDAQENYNLNQHFNNINDNDNQNENNFNDGGFPVIKETKDTQDINLELACPHLVKAAEISLGELEIQANIVRTLSVLSEHDACCNALCEYTGRIGMLLGACNNNNSNNDNNNTIEKPLTILSRLGYILGNIMARFDSARIQFYQNDVAMEYLLDALDIYSKQKFTIHNQMGDTVVDVLIKLVRVIANMSVNADVGFGLGIRSPLGKILLHLLMTTNKIRGTQLTSEIEELLQAILGALHNLCFYQDQTENSPYHNEKESFEDDFGSMSDLISEFSIELCEALKTGPESIRSEIARVLGNMTRNSIARDGFCSKGGLKIIVKCLSSEDYDLRATAIGVLVNLLGDWERRAPFGELKGPSVLRENLEKSGQQEDWLLAGIICQALWNFLIDSGNVISALGSDEADKISEKLAEYLDEERIFKGENPDILWEQFATVATDLLERIQIGLSEENTPFSSDDEDAPEVNINKIPVNDGLMEGRWEDKKRHWLHY